MISVEPGADPRRNFELVLKTSTRLNQLSHLMEQTKLTAPDDSISGEHFDWKV